MCYFVGHSDSPESIYPQLLSEVRRHVEALGVKQFIVGQYGSFDRMAARAAAEVKKDYPFLHLTLLLPYHPAERPFFLPVGFDDSLYPPDMERVPRKPAISLANKYIIDHAQYIICFAKHPGSNSVRLAAYAQKEAEKRNLQITFIDLE